MKLTKEDVKKYGTEEEQKLLEGRIEDFSETKIFLIGISTDLNRVDLETEHDSTLTYQKKQKINFLANQARELIKKAIKITES